MIESSTGHVDVGLAIPSCDYAAAAAEGSSEKVTIDAELSADFSGETEPIVEGSGGRRVLAEKKWRRQSVTADARFNTTGLGTEGWRLRRLSSNADDDFVGGAWLGHLSLAKKPDGFLQVDLPLHSKTRDVALDVQVLEGGDDGGPTRRRLQEAEVEHAQSVFSKVNYNLAPLEPVYEATPTTSAAGCKLNPTFPPYIL